MILKHMDHIFFKFLLVLKVKGRRGREIVDCLEDVLRFKPEANPVNPEAGKQACSCWKGHQRRTVLSKSECDLGVPLWAEPGPKATVSKL
jgi:hypothetical protein